MFVVRGVFYCAFFCACFRQTFLCTKQLLTWIACLLKKCCNLGFWFEKSLSAKLRTFISTEFACLYNFYVGSLLR